MPLLGWDHPELTKTKSSKSRKQKTKISIDQGWAPINPHAARVDIVAREHWVCVPPGSAPNNARAFGTFTSDLAALADWLVECGVQTVAMEATGIYWIPVFQTPTGTGAKR